MNRFFERVLMHPELLREPPVLLDVGASQSAPPEWKHIAPYAICVAVDADSREMGYLEALRRRYHKFYLLDKVAHVGPEAETSFHLTRFPLCSSLLLPNAESLAEWAFADSFDVQQTKLAPAQTLPAFLASNGLNHVDWIKLDTQGTDLRLFESLGEAITSQTVVAEFEPGIIDAYIGEDKMHDVMRAMETRGFWLAELNVKGSVRIRKSIIAEHMPSIPKRFVNHLLSPCPCWGEMLYMRQLRRPGDIRGRMLDWLFATLIGQHGHAIAAAEAGMADFGDPLFEQMMAHTLRKLRTAAWMVPVSVLRRKLASWIQP